MKEDFYYISDVIAYGCRSQSVHPQDVIRRWQRTLEWSIPLHGTGKEPVMRALEEVGFTQYHCKVTADPTGIFPVQYPNPEDQDNSDLPRIAKEDAHCRHRP